MCYLDPGLCSSPPEVLVATPHPKPTLKGAVVRLERFALGLAVFGVSLVLLLRFKTMNAWGHGIAALALSGLLVALWKRDRLFPLSD